jgi:HrpA-like RNA helicase
MRRSTSLLFLLTSAARLTSAAALHTVNNPAREIHTGIGKRAMPFFTEKIGHSWCFLKTIPVPSFASIRESICRHSLNRRRELRATSKFSTSKPRSQLNTLAASASWEAQPLPIDSVLPDLLKILKEHNCCVLQAPPGAGKTTRVPLALLSNPTVLPHGVSPAMRILILEPRILATKAAAARMAESLGEPIGRTIGYRVRYDTQAPAHRPPARRPR